MPKNGNGHQRALHFTHPPQRVVSLVPSLTESLFDLGFGSSVVGVTDYCIYPPALVRGLPKVGGTKNPRVQAILDLKPDLVIANQEENTRQVIEALEAQGAPVWVTFPQTVRQAVDVLWVLVGLFNSRIAGIQLETLERTLDWMEGALEEQERWRYFCPIWYERHSSGVDWWMTFNQLTYMDDLLHLVGGVNIFAERQRSYPLEADLGFPGAAADAPDAGRDTRYPRVTSDEIYQAQPEVIIFPSEPFAFTDSHLQYFRDHFADLPAVKNDRLYLLDGSLLTWHGTRLGKAVLALQNMNF